MSETAGLIIIPRLRVENVNAISGPLSWGFPSPTAFTGFTHALARRLKNGFDIEFGGVGIVCHRFDPQVSQPAGRRNQVFCLTRNPLYAGWKKFEDKPASIVEEGRAHMEISLLIELLTELDEDEWHDLQEPLMSAIYSMRLAGGSILPGCDKRRQPLWIEWSDDPADNITEFRKQRHRLLPGFALVHRESVLKEHLNRMRQQNKEINALDALLDLTRLNFAPGKIDPDKPNEIPWEIRSTPGWLVPIPVGYAAISRLYAAGEVNNARDAQIPFRFVESLYSLGEWVSPHRVMDATQLFWRHEADAENGIYRCINQYEKIT